MAKVFGVSRNGFYYWINNRHKVTQRSEHRKQLDSKVQEIFADKKERDGARRIQKELGENGNKHDVKTIAASMKRQGLVAKGARKFKCTTDSKHRLPVASNLLDQNYNVSTKSKMGWISPIRDERRLDVFSCYYRPVFTASRWLVNDYKNDRNSCL